MRANLGVQYVGNDPELEEYDPRTPIYAMLLMREQRRQEREQREQRRQEQARDRRRGTAAPSMTPRRKVLRWIAGDDSHGSAEASLPPAMDQMSGRHQPPSNDERLRYVNTISYTQFPYYGFGYGLGGYGPWGTDPFSSISLSM